MTLAYGFFNSVGGDRVYDAEDFSRYLEGILANGCFPNDTGFKALANSEPIGANPPSIIISAGKAYYNGMWVYNPQNYVYSLGTVQQSTPGMKHLVYFCYDKNDNGRDVTIECLTSADPVLPTNAAGKYYMPLALVLDQLNSQPLTAHITDQRLMAGVAATSVGTNSLLDQSVTTPKYADLSLSDGKIIDKTITGGKHADHSIGMLQLAKSGIYIGTFASSYEASHGPTQGQVYDFTLAGNVLNYTPIMDVNLFVVGSFTGTHVNPSSGAVYDYDYAWRNASQVIVGGNNYIHLGGAPSTFGGGIAFVIPLTADVPYTFYSCGKTGAPNGQTYANLRASGFIFALPR